MWELREVPAELRDRYRTDGHWTDDTLRTKDDMYGEQWARGYTLTSLILHQVHHRGQMTVLMRQAAGGGELEHGRVLIVGGCEATDGLPFGSSEIYDPATRKFSVTGSLSVERDFETATLLRTVRRSLDEKLSE